MPEGGVETSDKHEEYVTSLINCLYALTIQENDFSSQAFLRWSVMEQVEEEKGNSEILERL